MRKKTLLYLAWLLLLGGGELFADSAQVPPDFQALLFYKVLNFDRTGAKRTEREFVVGVVYRSDRPQSKEHFEEVFSGFHQQLEDKVLFEKSIRVLALPVAKDANIETLIPLNSYHALYLCQDLAETFSEIVAVSRANKIITLSAAVEYLYEGVTIGVKLVGGKSKIIINKASTTGVGLNLDPRFLQLAEIIPGK